MNLHALITRIADSEALDGVADAVAGVTTQVFNRPAVRDVLSGRPLGHPLHPLLTDVPVGAFTTALVLDTLGGQGLAPAADACVAVGLASVAPTAAAGWSDWADAVGPERRVGLVHAGANLLAAALYTASLAARRSGRRGAGRLLGLGGMGALLTGGYLGGHLSYKYGTGVDHTAFEHGPDDWTDVMPDSDLPENACLPATVGEVRVLLTRRQGVVSAISDTCTHFGGPLHEGEVDLAAGRVTCPWHGSVFRVDDGGVVRGPASLPQPRYAVRVEAGRILVRSAQPQH